MTANFAGALNPSHDYDMDMSVWPDEALVCWICTKQQGNHAAMSTLMTRYRPWIYRRCQFRLGNHHDAEDATHDIISRVHGKLHQYRGQAKFSSWLNRIIDNFCNTYAVRRARYTTVDHIEQLIEIHEQSYTPDPYAIYDEQEQMREALSYLSDSARQVIYLRFYNDLSLEEIAQKLSLTLSAAKARLYRAIEQLKLSYNEFNTA